MAIDDVCHQTSELPSDTTSMGSTSQFVEFVGPIEQVSSRVKSVDRIVAKARRVGCPLTPEWMRRTILDIAGVRVVFSKPKPNGYKSLHMTIEIPVLMPDRGSGIGIIGWFRPGWRMS